MERQSTNGRGRLRIYSDEESQLFDKLRGSLHTRLQNALIEYEDRETGQRQVWAVEDCVYYEDGRYVYINLRGRRVSQIEPLSTQHEAAIPNVPRRQNHPVQILDE